jgi:hypothetical protein
MQLVLVDLQLNMYTSTRTSKTDADLGWVGSLIMSGVEIDLPTHVLSRSGVH